MRQEQLILRLALIEPAGREKSQITQRFTVRTLGWFAILCLVATAATRQPLRSWNDGPAKDAIVKFVTDVTTQGAPTFVAPEERIAAFDNDSTLWTDQPIYVQFAFMLDTLKAVAPKHPGWKDNPAFRALVTHDTKALAAMGQKPVLELLATANSGMTVTEYDKSIRDWLATAKHPKFNRPYTDLVYVPMQELLAYLRANDFKTFIVSGGSVEFMRPWAEKAYGIPAEQIIGSQQEVKFEMRDGKPVVIRTPKIAFVGGWLPSSILSRSTRRASGRRASASIRWWMR